MNGQGERWTAERVLSLAPDAASRRACGKLAMAGPWSGTGTRGRAVWGLCKGGSSRPYQTVVELDGPGGPAYTCSCPSHKSPCKHALGLLLLWAGEEGQLSVPEGEPPEFAEQWLGGRRKRSGTAAGRAGRGAAGANQEAARKRAERRALRISAGAVELEQRLADLLREGLARLGDDDSHAGYARWEESAARMVDAQAPGLEARVRELAALRASGTDWPARLLEECALTHLLNQSYLRVEQLPTALATTTRARVGISTHTTEVLASVPPVRDRWLVLGQQDSDDGKITTRRIWLRGEGSGRMALLLSFGVVGRAPEVVLPTGMVVDADVFYHPSARPLRAVLGTGHTEPAPSAASAGPPGTDVATALAEYGGALRDDPWLESWPTVLSQVTPIPGPEGWQLADVPTGSALPIDPRCLGRAHLWRLAAVSGGRPVTVFGECGHRGFVPLTTWDPQPVPL